MQVSSINSVAEARRLIATEVNAEGANSTAAASGATQTNRQASVAARQFEAIILRQLLTPAIEPMMSNGLGGEGSSSGGGVYGYLVTDVLANSLSQGGGLGLSRMLEKQLTPKCNAPAAQVAATYRAGEQKS